ncbi:MAG: hypothetical protein E3J36_02160 [Candidatus Nealsonbacteria bacterium]|nr:MAG: hypothetical protein E3J36_02160 [Candidatus Nealsonbacteria bacterium]
MKVEIAQEKENGKKYTALLITEQGPALSQKFDSPFTLLAFLRKRKALAKESSEPFAVVRKTN